MPDKRPEDISKDKWESGGESQGGSYPHASRDKNKHEKPSHGGQSEMAYHGHGQLGGDDLKDADNANAAAKDA